MNSQPTMEEVLASKQTELAAAIKNGATVQLGVWQYLQDSEEQLIQLMRGTPPPPDAPGNIEFSWALYYLNNDAYSWLKALLKDIDMPDSRISKAEWDRWWIIWEGQGVCMGDGSLVSTATYAVMDPAWSVAIISYMMIQLDIIDVQPFVTTPATIALPEQDTITIAVFGDWGTGNYRDGNLTSSPSQLVMEVMDGLNPDVMIHLGDVYYSGTFFEEQNKLVNDWQAAPHGNFTLNSNHEMYDGANGLYNLALQNPLFSAQNGSTYFALTFQNWIIFGLDSAYDSTSMYMDGAITNQSQIDFIKSFNITGKKVLVLTHHNPVDVLGETLNSLWTDVNTALGQAPDVWYWGHIHNGIVYNANSACGATEARCLGNGAIPIGNAPWLEHQRSVSFYTHKPLGDTFPRNALRVQNGFAILTLSASTMTESWYNQDGTVAWRG